MIDEPDDPPPDPADVETIRKILSVEGGPTVAELIKILRDELEQIDIEDGEAIRELVRIIDLANALGEIVRPQGVKVYNRAAELKIRAERKAGEWINLHPESLD